MRAIVGILTVLSGATAFAGYSFCAPIPTVPGLPCPVVWGCPCPVDGGTQGTCDYHPVMECIDAKGNCTGSGQLVGYDCQPLGKPCEQPDDFCTAAAYEIPTSGWSVDGSGHPTWPPGTTGSATCTLNPHPNPKCEREQYCNPGIQCCQSFGDPISVKDDNSVHRVEDVRLPTSLGPLVFERNFTRSHYAYAWMHVPADVKPFGTSPMDAKSMHWNHNWHSMVRTISVDGDTEYGVLDTAGMLSRFKSCSPVPCYAAPVAASPTHDMLYVEASRTTLLRENVGRFVYEASLGDRRYLSRWEDTQYPASGENPRVRATLSYANPPGCSTLSPSGVPYLAQVESADGAKLVFSWAPGSSGCFIKSVAVGKGAATQTAVQYALTQGANRLTLAATYGSDGGTGAETYDFIPDGGWWVTRNGAQVARHAYSGTLSDFGQGDVELFRKGGAEPALCTVAGCDASVSYNWTEYAPVRQQTYRLDRSRTVTLETTSSSTQPLLTSTVDKCDEYECPNFSSRARTYEKAPTQYVLKSANNAEGGFTVNAYAPGATLPTGQTQTELVSTVRGATDSAGTSPLLSTHYAYSYGSAGQTPRGWEQYVAQESRPSLLSPGQQARTITRRDAATNRVTAEIRTGWTREFSPASAVWTTVAKTIGTFYFTQRNCTDHQADPLGRTLEVHGPCFVADSNATDCPSGVVFPVTQFSYYTASAANPLNANRLEFERHWVSVSSPTSCAGVQLTTTYDTYDVRGNPGTITDPNGIQTTIAYDEGRTKTVRARAETTRSVEA